MVDLYDATLDDYCRAALQSTQYQNYLKGRLGGSGPDRMVLKLRTASRSGNSKKVAQILVQLSTETKMNSRIPHLEGESIFGTAKRKLDLPPGDESDSHRHDRVNFTLPKLGRGMSPSQSRSLRSPSPIAGMPPSHVASSIDKQPPSQVPLTILGLPIVESSCINPMGWRIERISGSATDLCKGYTVDGKRCNARMAKYKKATPAPTFTGIQKVFRSRSTE